MLICPLDGHELESRVDGQASHSYCGRCDGVWFSGASLRRGGSRNAAARGALDQARVARSELRVCPECSEALKAERIDGIEIDRCAHCGGVWLDAGELEVVRARLLGPEASTAPNGSTSFWNAPIELGASLADAGFRIAVEGAFELISNLVD